MDLVTLEDYWGIKDKFRPPGFQKHYQSVFVTPFINSKWLMEVGELSIKLLQPLTGQLTGFASICFRVDVKQ